MIRSLTAIALLTQGAALFATELRVSVRTLSGDVVPKVSMELVDRATKQVRAFLSNELGEAVLRDVGRGAYTISASQRGFHKASWNVIVAGEETLWLQVGLRLGRLAIGKPLVVHGSVTVEASRRCKAERLEVRALFDPTLHYLVPLDGGRYSVNVIHPGVYVFSVECNGSALSTVANIAYRKELHLSF